MKLFRLGVCSVLLAAAASATTSPAAGQTPTAMGKLILSGDLVKFGTSRGDPELCIMKSRYKRGEGVGFRVTAIDGGTGAVETSAEVVIHVTHGGKTVDIPSNYRGDDVGGFGPIPCLWTARWNVPADAPIGIVRFKVTAKDNKGRTAEWTIFQNNPDALLTIVE